MPIVDILKSNPETALRMSIQQVVTMCGEGRLGDGNPASEELRAFLSQIPSIKLFDYARQCLDSDVFENRGFALQDVVNQLGRRLDFAVEAGLYRGRRNQVGFDGLWTPTTGPAYVVEVKTTDAYLTNLAPFAEYRRQLVQAGRVSEDSTILIVVGRQDTGGLEAQVRGSPFAWDMRILGVEALIKLVRVKEQSNSAAVLKQMQEILRPVEYTRVDKIIDLVFTTAEDIDEQESLEEQVETDETDAPRRHAITPRGEIEGKRQSVIAAFGRLRRESFIKSRLTLYWNADQSKRICVVVSKRYPPDAAAAYWYRFDPDWLEYLKGGKEAYYILSCMDNNDAFAIPTEVMGQLTSRLNVTTREDESFYWHIHFISAERGHAALKLRGGDSFPIEGYRFSIS